MAALKLFWRYGYGISKRGFGSQTRSLCKDLMTAENLLEILIPFSWTFTFGEIKGENQKPKAARDMLILSFLFTLIWKVWQIFTVIPLFFRMYMARVKINTKSQIWKLFIGQLVVFHLKIYRKFSIPISTIYNYYRIIWIFVDIENIFKYLFHIIWSKFQGWATLVEWKGYRSHFWVYIIRIYVEILAYTYNRIETGVIKNRIYHQLILFMVIPYFMEYRIFLPNDKSSINSYSPSQAIRLDYDYSEIIKILSSKLAWKWPFKVSQDQLLFTRKAKHIGSMLWLVWHDVFLVKNIFQVHGRPQGGRGEASPPPHETEKSVVEKWCYFPELYKMTEVREEGVENG